MATFIHKKTPISSLATKTEVISHLQVESVLWFQKIGEKIPIRSSIITVTIKAIIQMFAQIH